MKELENLKSEVKEVKKQWDNHKSIVVLKNKIVQLQGELEWAKIRDSRQECREIEAKLAEVQAKCTDIQDNLQNRDEKVEAINQQVL